MIINENVALYGNVDFSKELQQNDKYFEKYCKKLSIVKHSLKVSFIRDNFGDYWLANFGTLEMEDLTFKIPNFVQGIIGTVPGLEFKKVSIQNESEDSVDARFNSSKWDLSSDKSDIRIDNLIQYTNPIGTLTIIGNGRALRGNMERLINNVHAKKIQFKSFNIEPITDLDTMFYGCNTGELDISGITFGKIESLANAFRCSYIGSDIDLSGMDLQNCKNYNQCFLLSGGIKRVRFPGVEIDRDTQLKYVFQHQQHLEAVDMQLVTSDTALKQKLLFRSCPNLKNIDLQGIYDIDNLDTLVERCYELKEIVLKAGNKSHGRMIEMELVLKASQCLKDLKVIWKK